MLNNFYQRYFKPRKKRYREYLISPFPRYFAEDVEENAVNGYFFVHFKFLFLKKLLIAVLFSSLLAQAAIAQPAIRLGVKGGANLTKIDGKQFKDGFNFNYYIGPYVELQLTSGFGIQPELLFTQSTSRTGDQFSDVYQEIGSEFNNHEIKLNYLTIPVMANIHLSNALILQLGPQYGILMDGNESLGENTKRAFKDGDFSGAAGLWLNLPLGLSVSGRYVIGMSDIKDLPEGEKWRSTAIQLGIGFRF